MGKKVIKKILIANRGEIALRVIRACKEMGIQTVSVYSKVDEKSLHKNFADESVCIGEAPSISSYLNIPRIIAAAQITGANAIYPGYGFLSENPIFAEVCEQNNIIFIGPDKKTMEMMGDKITAKETMKKAGVNQLPSSGNLSNREEALKEAKRIGYPVILKATAGGGGKGMRICENKKDILKYFEVTKTEAMVSFGNPDVYMEKYLKDPYHVEIQVIGDSHGNYIHLGERDCSIQRNHQKLIEETPSIHVDQKLREEIFSASLRAVKLVNYEGTGTLEFLVDKNNYYFMEMNTRIQVEHTISELYTGIDIIKEQIRVAMGEKLSYQQDQIIYRGHVIECRINAEDPENGFIPSPGKINRYHIPQGLGVRVDSHVFDGYEIPSNYDSMIAKLIVWGLNREEAISRMKRSLDEIVISGVKTTIPLHFQIITSNDFKTGKFSTNFLNKFSFKK